MAAQTRRRGGGLRMDATRTIRLVVRPRNRRATLMIQEGDSLVNYAGGEVADVALLEALAKLATGNFDALEPLTDDETAYVNALMDRTWAPRHGRYPRPEDFNLEGIT